MNKEGFDNLMIKGRIAVRCDTKKERRTVMDYCATELHLDCFRDDYSQQDYPYVINWFNRVTGHSGRELRDKGIAIIVYAEFLDGIYGAEEDLESSPLDLL